MTANTDIGTSSQPIVEKTRNSKNTEQALLNSHRQQCPRETARGSKEEETKEKNDERMDWQLVQQRQIHTSGKLIRLYRDSGTKCVDFMFLVMDPLDLHLS